MKKVIKYPTKYPAIIATDTLYGLVAPALDVKAMQKLRELKGRPKGKPFIILIGAISELKKFNVKLTPVQEKIIKELWPGPISIVLGRYAFRLPQSPALKKLLIKTGPLAAPSANPAGEPPAKTISEAKKYFGDQVKTYIAGQVKNSQPSTLIKLSPAGKISILRQGVAVIKLNEVQ